MPGWSGSGYSPGTSRGRHKHHHKQNFTLCCQKLYHVGSRCFHSFREYVRYFVIRVHSDKVIYHSFYPNCNLSYFFPDLDDAPVIHAVIKKI